MLCLVELTVWVFSVTGRQRANSSQQADLTADVHRQTACDGKQRLVQLV